MNRHFRPFALFVALLAIAPVARSDEVDDLVAAQMQKQHIPGLSLAIVKRGRIIRARGYGLANVELQVPVRPESVFQAGSIGKQFTATGIMLLVQDEKLGLDDKIVQYFPKAPAAWQAITVRHLLSHTSGLKNYGPEDLNYHLDYSEDELFDKIAAFPLDFPPGEKWSYSNTGYVVLGMLIRKVTREFYGDFLQQRIFKPLSMTTTRIITEEDIVPNRAAGYRLVDGRLKNQEWVSPSLNTTADGSLYLTVLDLAKWDAALYDDRLLSKQSLQQMWTPVETRDGKPSEYGFGWAIEEVRGHRLIKHGGAWQGFVSTIARYVDDGVTIIILTNLAGAKLKATADGIAGVYIPDLAPRETSTGGDAAQRD